MALFDTFTPETCFFERRVCATTTNYCTPLFFAGATVLPDRPAEINKYTLRYICYYRCESLIVFKNTINYHHKDMLRQTRNRADPDFATPPPKTTGFSSHFRLFSGTPNSTPSPPIFRRCNRFAGQTGRD